ncbi:MAG: glutamate--cysteine ligase, partial [Deltaproteobacteria bacterium]|nr:glutamate--cysteine ligase [Deltaproteobacteria bacterium]
LSTIAHADRAIIHDERFLRSFGLGTGPLLAGELWAHLIDTQISARPELASAASDLAVISKQGCLARRITEAAGPDASRERLREVYGRLAECLRHGEIFSGHP